MIRFLTAAIAAALVFGAAGLTTSQPAAAQPGGPSVCLNLAPGDHTFTAPARDREGEVTFSLTVGEGGVVTSFTEPGGQSIPPVAMLDIFTGADAYPLPDGVAIVECEAAGDGMTEDATPGVCVNLSEGTHTGTVSASGRSYEITMHIGEGGQVNSVELLGQSYPAQEAIGLLEGFGATLPQGIQIVPCADGDQPAPVAFANTGTGGLADATDRTGLWAGLGSLAALAIAIAAVAQRRRTAVRNRD